MSDFVMTACRSLKILSKYHTKGKAFLFKFIFFRLKKNSYGLKHGSESLQPNSKCIGNLHQ